MIFGDFTICSVKQNRGQDNDVVRAAAGYEEYLALVVVAYAGFGVGVEAGSGAALNCALTWATAFSAVRPCFWRR